jgi:hypothetical protein
LKWKKENWNKKGISWRLGRSPLPLGPSTCYQTLAWPIFFSPLAARAAQPNTPLTPTHGPWWPVAPHSSPPVIDRFPTSTHARTVTLACGACDSATSCTRSPQPLPCGTPESDLSLSSNGFRAATAPWPALAGVVADPRDFLARARPAPI